MKGKSMSVWGNYSLVVSVVMMGKTVRNRDRRDWKEKEISSVETEMKGCPFVFPQCFMV